jgi:hypothetical protein
MGSDYQTKQSLVYDLQEPFRWFADFSVIQAFESSTLDFMISISQVTIIGTDSTSDIEVCRGRRLRLFLLRFENNQCFPAVRLFLVHRPQRRRQQDHKNKISILHRTKTRSIISAKIQEWRGDYQCSNDSITNATERLAPRLDRRRRQRDWILPPDGTRKPWDKYVAALERDYSER